MRKWEELIKKPIALSTPILSIPEIQKALNDPSIGFQKAAKILLAARLAITMRLRNDSLETLKRVAEN